MEDKVIHYRGYAISRDNDEYSCVGMSFETLLHAKAHIDNVLDSFKPKVAEKDASDIK